MNHKKKFIFIIACLVLIGLTYRVYQNYQERSIYSATLEATIVDLSSQIQSTILQVSAREGDQVTTGQVLAELTCEDIKVAFTQVERDFRRAQSLQKDGSLSREGYEHAESRYEDLTIKRGWCSLKSPINGTLLTSLREPGELVLPGQKIFVLADLNNLWGFIYVSATEMHLVQLGKKLDVYLPQTGQRVKATIIKINSVAEFTPKNIQTRRERDNLVYGVKLQLDQVDGKIYPGMLMETKLHE